MQKSYTVNLTANEINLLMQLAEHEANFYDKSDDETDTALFDSYESVLDKLYKATQAREEA